MVQRNPMRLALIIILASVISLPNWAIPADGKAPGEIQGVEFIAISGPEFSVVYSTTGRICLKIDEKKPGGFSVRESVPETPEAEDEICLDPGTMSVILKNQLPSTPQPVSPAVKAQAEKLVATGISMAPGTCAVGTLPGVNLVEVANDLMSRGADLQKVKDSLEAVCFAADAYTYTKPADSPVPAAPSLPGGGGGSGGGAMGNIRPGMRQIVGICLIILIVLFSAGVKAAEPQPEKPVVPQAEDETVTEKKPPEKPPELLPQYGPGGTPYSPIADYGSTNFGPGPMTGALAPYGNSAAEDTLIRGWRVHRLGGLRISPYFEYDALYRTNVFQTYNNKKSDFVNMVNPGLRFELPVASAHKLSLGYLGNYYLYSRFSSISHYDHNLNADLALNFSKLSLRVGNTYRNAVEEPTLLQTGPTLTVGRERPYNLISPYLKGAYNLTDRWRIETNYQFNYLKYTESLDRYDDVQNNVVGATIFYKFLPKTSALLQYIADIRTHPFNHIKDNVVQTPMVGLTWEPTAKLSGTIKVGYAIASYNNSNPGGNTFSQGFNPDGVALSIQTQYRLTRYTQMSLTAQRVLQEDPNSGNDAYFNSGLMFTVSHLWHYFDVTSYASISYYNNSYIFNNFNPGTTELKKRVDNIIYAGAGLSRPITRWLKLRLDYVYYNRGSNFSSYPTNEHKILLGLQTSF